MPADASACVELGTIAGGLGEPAMAALLAYARRLQGNQCPRCEAIGRTETSRPGIAYKSCRACGWTWKSTHVLRIETSD